jgi:lysozyme family protein
MANFNLSVQYVLENEGGYVDIPEDRGGPTNFGITIPTLSAFRRESVGPDDIKNLKREEAINIFYHNYYAPLKLSYIEQNNIVTAILDVAVNCGLSNARIFVEKTLISLLYETGSEWMDETYKKSLNEVSQEQFIDRFEIFLMAHYNNLVLIHPSDAKFLKGWSRRAMRLLTLK